MDSVVHFEIPVDDVGRAEEFYTKAFGWTMNHMPNFEYTMISTTPTDDVGMPKQPGSINGGMPKRVIGVEHIVVTIRVESIDSSLEKIEKLGGKTVAQKMPVADMGFTAYL